jgi:hypothetical protein
MTLQLDLRQTNTIEPGPVYKVLNEITYAEDIAAEVFVFDTDTQEFAWVASVWDVMNLPIGHAAAVAAGSPNYRKDTADVGYPSVETAIRFAEYIRVRVQALLDAYKSATEDFEGITDYVFTPS